MKDIKGLTFGKLTVESKTDKRDSLGCIIWVCKCECGNTKEISGAQLRGNQVKSCGCARPKLEFGESAFNNLLYEYKKRSETKNQEFNLSEEDFRSLTSSNCYYCGSEPKAKRGSKTNHGYYIYNGIDRVDNSKGYIYGNVVPCCAMCNRAKGAFKETEFLSWIARVHKTMVDINRIEYYNKENGGILWRIKQ